MASGEILGFSFELQLDVAARSIPEQLLCRRRDVVLLSGVHMCEAGVLAPPRIEASVTFTVDDPDAYRRLIGG